MTPHVGSSGMRSIKKCLIVCFNVRIVRIENTFENFFNLVVICNDNGPKLKTTKLKVVVRQI